MDIRQNHFELFGLPARFALDAAALDGAYRDLQNQVHPDRFARASDAEQRVALQWATRANEAYQTLRDPLRRAAYLCTLAGTDLATETNTAMPADFLMQQMEWRDTLGEARAARDLARLESLAEELASVRRDVLARIGALLDGPEGADAAAPIVRQLMFLERFGDDIADAIDHH